MILALFCYLHVVRDDYHAVRLSHFFEQVHDRVCHVRVQRCGRFVEQEYGLAFSGGFPTPGFGRFEIRAHD